MTALPWITALLLLSQAPVRTAAQWSAAGWDALRAGAAQEAATDFAEAPVVGCWWLVVGCW